MTVTGESLELHCLQGKRRGGGGGRQWGTKRKRGEKTKKGSRKEKQAVVRRGVTGNRAMPCTQMMQE